MISGAKAPDSGDTSADDMGTMAAVPLKVRPAAQDNARLPFFTGCSPGRVFAGGLFTGRMLSWLRGHPPGGPPEWPPARPIGADLVR